jgi:hypothetical protein
MKRSMRLPMLVLAAVLVAGPTASGWAAGARPASLASAKLFVIGASQAAGGAGGVRIKYQEQQGDDPVAKVTFYVPQGYQVTTSQTAGTKLGAAAATVFAGDLNAVVPVTGTVETAAAGEFAAQATACTGTPTHSAIWALRLQAAGTPLTVPVFVDAITAPPLSTLAVAQLVICLAPPDVPPNTPGRAPLGAKVLTADFTSNALVNPSARGEHRWRATVTPYTPAQGTPNAAATIELQSLVELPSQITLKAKARRSAKRGVSTVGYSGTLLSNLQGIEGASIDVLKGATARSVKKFKTQTTDSSGAFSGSFAQKQAKRASLVYVVAKATVPDRDLGAAACQATFVPPAAPFPIPCQDATIGGFTLTGSAVKVTIPKRA